MQQKKNLINGKQNWINYNLLTKGIISLLIFQCLACQVRENPIWEFERSIKKIILADDVEKFHDLYYVSSREVPPFILPYAHQSLLCAALEVHATKIIDFLLLMLGEGCQCQIFKELDILSTLKDKELRVRVLEELGSLILVKRLFVHNGEIEYWTFLDYYKSKKDDYIVEIGEFEYYDYLSNLEYAFEDAKKRVLRAKEKLNILKEKNQ